MARIALVGPGAVGGVIAAWLAQGGHEITLCARRPFTELNVETPGGPLLSRPHVITDPAQATTHDWVLVATKAYDAAGAAAWFPGLVAARTRVAILQNGVEHRERFTPWLPAAQLLPVMVDIPCERSAPGRIRQRGAGRMVVPEEPAGREFVALFTSARLDVSTSPDFKSVAWRKLCQNAAGVMSALTLRPAEVMHDAGVSEVARALVRECITVGRAEGAVLEDSLVDWVINTYRGAPPDSMNSLHADRAAGRPMEIDARNGAIVRLGRKHGTPTPCNQMAVALLEAMSPRS
jgi:2-dehydropantoate 2-reductase